MELLTPELEKRFKEVGSQQDNPDPLVIVKFFDPYSGTKFYATEYDPDNGIYYGYAVELGDSRWRRFYEMERCLIDPPFALRIGRDLHFKEKPISEAVPALEPQIREAKLAQARKTPEKGQEPER